MSATLTVPAITDTSFAAETAPGTGLVAVEFSAAWCAPCRMMAPIIETAAREYGPSIRIFTMDTEENPATMVKLGVRGLPTMLVFRDGEPVDRIVGAIPLPSLRERLDRLLRR